MLTINQPQLNSEQIASIPEYRRKWQEIATNNKSIDREQATTAIYNAYRFLNLPQPNIIFFLDPKGAIQYINSEMDNSWGKLENSSLGNPVATKLISELIGNLDNQIKGEIFEHLQGNLDNGLADNMAREIIDYYKWNNIFTLIGINGRSFMLDSATNSQADEVMKIFSNILFDTGFIFNRYIFPLCGQFRKIP
ncbi:MAG: hypothetical protein AAFQ91_21755 [Cyanobacteria bacterium J06621_15]